MQNFSNLQFSKLGLVVKFDCPTKTLIRAFPCTRPNAPREPQHLTNLLMVNSLFHYLTVCLAHEQFSASVTSFIFWSALPQEFDLLCLVPKFSSISLSSQAGVYTTITTIQLHVSKIWILSTQHHRCYLKLASNILFSVPNKPNKLQQMHFEFPLTLFYQWIF